MNASFLAKCAPFLLILLWCTLCAPGCTSRYAIEDARKRGADTGYIDGKKAGESDGFSSALRDQEHVAYKRTFNSLYSRVAYQRNTVYELFIACCAFLSGFVCQFILFYGLRRIKVLNDVDRVLLGSHATELDLAQIINGHPAAEVELPLPPPVTRPNQCP